MKVIGLLYSMVFICCSISLSGQQLLMDRGVRVADLWCFPLFEKPNTYLYLPSEAGITYNSDSIPEFSFMQYVFEKAVDGLNESSINEADGGAILHFLIHYYTQENQVSEAEELLRSKMDNDEIIIRGPVVFEEAHFSLVSSILNSTTGENENKLIGIGKAPVLENSKIALSFDISARSSSILMESFKMQTPDISLVFELGFSGLTDNYKATLEVDWDEVGKSQEFSAGGSVYFIGADVELGFEKLRKNGAIKLTSVGADENMNALLNTVYDKLITIMFDPVRPNDLPNNSGGLTDALSAMIGADGMLSSSNTTGFGLHAGYKLKEFKTTGKGILEFRGRSVVNRPHFVVSNIGNLYQEYGHNNNLFKRVTPESDYSQRDIFISIDGDLEKEFTNLVNSVTVSVQKIHQSGSTSLKEMTISRESFIDYKGPLSFSYLNKKDSIYMDWLKYDYKTSWQFRGGGSYTMQWTETDVAMINLYTPFRRKRIYLDGDLEFLKEKGVRALSIKIDYSFFDDSKSDRITLRPNSNLEELYFEITLPNEIDRINYTIDWVMEDHSTRSQTGVDEIGLIFIDELPGPE